MKKPPVIIRLLFNALVILALDYILPGIEVKDFWSAIIAAVVIGLLNVFLRPILTILTIPFTIITFGLFLLVINAFMVWLASQWLSGFAVANFWWAILFSILVTLLNAAFYGAGTPPANNHETYGR